VEFFFSDSANVKTESAYLASVCLHGAGRLSEARTVLEGVAAESEQSRDFAVAWLGVVAAQQEDTSSARSYLHRLAPPGDDSTNLVLRARVAAALGDRLQAVALLTRRSGMPGWEFCDCSTGTRRIPAGRVFRSYPPYRSLHR
jgi:hypothetical protein